MTDSPLLTRVVNLNLLKFYFLTCEYIIQTVHWRVNAHMQRLFIYIPRPPQLKNFSIPIK